jgi:hypothetical protein
VSEPTRLRDQGGPGALLLGAAADDGPSATSFERTARRLGVAGAVLGATSTVATTAAGGTAAKGAVAGGVIAGAGLGAGSAAGTAAGVASGSVSVLAAKIGLAFVVSAALVGGATIATRPSTKLAQPTTAAPTTTEIAPPTPANAAHEGSGGARPPESAAKEPTAEATTAPAPSATSPMDTAPKKATPGAKGASPDPLRDEVLRLDEARAKLARGDAAGALVSLDQHAREFPRGFLGAEAEVLRVEALFKAGRTDEARARGERLLAREPNGPHAKRLRTLLGL